MHPDNPSANTAAVNTKRPRLNPIPFLVGRNWTDIRREKGADGRERPPGCSLTRFTIEREGDGTTYSSSSSLRRRPNSSAKNLHMTVAPFWFRFFHRSVDKVVLAGFLTGRNSFLRPSDCGAAGFSAHGTGAASSRVKRALQVMYAWMTARR